MTVQYQGVWTLQSAAQLQSTQRWVTDPLFENTTLLLQADDAANGAQNNTFLDSSSNSFAITRNGNTTQGSFTPFSSQPGAWGNYFSGSGNGFLNAVSNAVFAFGTGDFTLEAFINVAAYPAAFPGTAAGNIISAHNWNGSGFDFTFRIQSTGLLYFENSAGNTLSSTTAVPLNTWVHVACVRSSGTLTFYINGSSVGSGAAAGSISSTVAISIGAALSGGTYGNFTGYISNARITRGGALYTTAFTPSMTPLTTTVSSGTVSLLTCQSNRFVDNSVNAFALTAGAGASVQAFSPFAPQFQWTPSVIGGSGFFDGTGDQLTLANNTAFDPGSGSFTLECWVYLTATTGSVINYSNGQTSNANFAWEIYQISATSIQATIVQGSTVYSAASSSFSLNAWNHVAGIRNGNTWNIFINGVGGGSPQNVTGVTVSSPGGSTVKISGYNNATGMITGYVSNIRMVLGQALATGNFTPPAAPVTRTAVGWTGANAASSITGTVSLLTNFTNAGIYDGTMKNNLETVGNAQISTAVVKYGSGSMFFDGTGDRLFANTSPNLNLATGDWTIECWIYLNALNAFQMVLNTHASSSSTSGIVFGISNGNRIYIGNGVVLGTSGNTSLVSGTWYHIAAVRIGSNVSFYLNGVLDVTPFSFTPNAGGFLTVGANQAGSDQLNGYIDDLRITRGIARYTQNFIPPSVALPRQ